jgi:hypothetical protein
LEYLNWVTNPFQHTPFVSIALKCKGGGVPIHFILKLI